MIETPRLLLRPPTMADRPALYAMWADAETMADLSPVKTPAEGEAALARHAGYAPLGFWAVERRDDGLTIGHLGLKPGAPGTPIEDRLEIGWIVARRYWGQGYAHEAAAASLAWVWANRAEQAVFAITARRNARSRALMERLGMRRMTDWDFDYPGWPTTDPLSPSVTYRIEKP